MLESWCKWLPSWLLLLHKIIIITTTSSLQVKFSYDVFPLFQLQEPTLFLNLSSYPSISYHYDTSTMLIFTRCSMWFLVIFLLHTTSFCNSITLPCVLRKLKYIRKYVCQNCWILLEYQNKATSAEAKTDPPRSGKKINCLPEWQKIARNSMQGWGDIQTFC